jgi:hypothetical protein
MPTVRIINVIEEPGGMLFSQRKNRVGDPPNASPAQSRTPPMAMTATRSRLVLIVGVPTLTSGTQASHDTRTTDQVPSRQVARSDDVVRARIGRSEREVCRLRCWDSLRDALPSCVFLLGRFRDGRRRARRGGEPAVESAADTKCEAGILGNRFIDGDGSSACEGWEHGG